MDIQQLKYFVEIVNCKNFTKAADKLVVTQPMLTRVLKQMEKDLGVKLIERTSKSFEMTDAGEVFYEKTVEFLERFHDLYRSVDDLKTLNAGEVTLSTPGVLLDLYFSKLLKYFYERYPNIKISIIEEGSKLTAQAVLDGAVDLGFVMLPVKNQHKLETSIVTSSICQVLVSKNHPFANRNVIHAQELKSERIITFSNTATLHDTFLTYCHKEGFEPNLSYRSLMPNFTVEMITYGLCIGLLPLPVIHRYMTEDVVTVPLEPPLLWDIAVISKKGRYKSFAASQMLEFISEYFKSL